MLAAARALALAVALAVQSSCAHPSAERTGAEGRGTASPAPAERGASPLPLEARREAVTGSHVSRPAEAPCDSLPSTADNVRVHCREELRASGRESDLGAALRTLDPSVSLRP